MVTFRTDKEDEVISTDGLVRIESPEYDREIALKVVRIK